MLFLQLFNCPFLCSLVVVAGVKNFEVTFLRPWQHPRHFKLAVRPLVDEQVRRKPTREVHRERKNGVEFHHAS